MSRGLGQNDKRNVTYVKCSQGLFIMRMSEPSKDTITGGYIRSCISSWC